MSAGGGGRAGRGVDDVAEKKSAVPGVIERLRTTYERVQKPLEKEMLFDRFHSPLLSPADFEARPMVLLLGQYSVGKTTFIRYLLGRDFPGIRIGPEPTTDRFTIVMKGEKHEEGTIPGNALAVHKDLPFTSLSSFGAGFLSRLEAAQCPAPVLDAVTLVDTPGVLSGEKQRIGRQYNFVEVVEWFAQRADMILLLFDAHKLDISDEFKSTIEALRGQDDKIRVVLNKADKISGQQLMRVYGAMMWALGKVVRTPEVMRVYIGSFWDGPCMNKDFEAMFRAEQSDLLKDLHNLPRNATVRKVNELVKRARLARVHALVISYLREQMPMMWGHRKKQEELIAQMHQVFFEVMKKYRLARGDFPDLKRFVERAAYFEFEKDFKKVSEKMIANLDAALADTIPALLAQLGHEKAAAEARIAAKELVLEGGIIKEGSATGGSYAGEGGSGYGGGAATGGGAWERSDPAAASVPPPSAPMPTHTPPPAPMPSPADPVDSMGGGKPGSETSIPSTGGGGSNPFATSGTHDSWARAVSKEARDAEFFALPGAREMGKVSGESVRGVMAASGLSGDMLFRIWNLSDIDSDGHLDDKEYAVAMTLIERAKAGAAIGETLPDELFPPTKRPGGGGFY